MSSTGVATEEISARRQLKTLQVGRGLAALAVLLYHASITLALPKYLDDPVATWALAGSSGVHFFFVLSGVIITLAHLGQINHPQKASAFLWRRFRRIYPPLWVACGLSIIGMMFVGAGIPDAGSLFSAFALTPVEHERVLAVAWTLRHEVVFYILFMTLILSVRLGVAALAIWFSASLFGFFVDLKFPIKFWLSPYNILFLFGIVSALVMRQDVKIPRLMVWFGVSIFLCSWIGVLVAQQETDHPLAIACFGVGAALSIIGFAKLEELGEVRVWPWLEYLGDASYSIYLTHFLTISLLAKIVTRHDIAAIFPNLFWFVLVSAGAVLAGMAFYHVVERPLLRVMPTKIGKR